MYLDFISDILGDVKSGKGDWSSLSESGAMVLQALERPPVAGLSVGRHIEEGRSPE
jgi:hypothetical protein